MATREALHDLLDDLPDRVLDDAESALRRLLADPVQRALDNAPIDDEPLTSEERASIDRAWESMSAGTQVDESDLAALLGA